VRKPIPEDCPKKGERLLALHGPQVARILSDPIEGWLVVRFKGAAPFLLHVNDWKRRLRRPDVSA